MIAITGATGNLGKAVLSFLLRKTQPSEIVAVARDPQKLGALADLGIIIRQADYNDPESLQAAFQNVSQLLHVSSAAYGAQAVAEECNVVNAAKLCGVSHVVYTSTLAPTDSPIFWGGQTCVQTEAAIRASGLRYSIFRNSMYLETIPLFIGNAMEDGQIYFPAGEGAISFVSRIDIAEAISNVLTNHAIESTAYEITGEKAFSFPEIAAELEAVKEISCSYTDIPGEALTSEMLKAGLSADEAAFYVNMGDSIKAGEFALVSADLEILLGKRRLTVGEYLRQIFKKDPVNAG